MESKTGSLLALISGIIWSAMCVPVIIFTIYFWNRWNIFGSFGSSGSDFGIHLYFIIFNLIIVLIAYLFILSSRWMKNKSKVRKGAIMSLVLGVITLPFGLINGVLSIIAGIIGLKDSKN